MSSNSRNSNTHRSLKLHAHQLNATGPRLIRSGKNYINSVPAHNYQLKTRRMFRFNQRIESQLVIDLDTLRALVRNELAVVAAASGIGEMFFVHGVRIYASANTDADFQVVSYDIEESTVNDHNINGAFTSTCDAAGVGFIHFEYPTNNRPTLTSNSQGTSKLLTFDQSAAEMQYVIDFDVTYIRTPTDSISRSFPISSNALPSE